MRPLLRHRFSYVDIAYISITVSVFKEYGVGWALAFLITASLMVAALESRYDG